MITVMIAVNELQLKVFLSPLAVRKRAGRERDWIGNSCFGDLDRATRHVR
jgi:hypothetical protein